MKLLFPVKNRAITVMERKLEVMDVSDKLEDTNSSAYSAQLHTDNVTPTKKGQRDSIPLTLQVINTIKQSINHKKCSFCPIQQIQENYEFSTHLQGKWYKSASTQHCDWGTSVHAIEYECSVDQQNNCIKILKDTFR